MAQPLGFEVRALGPEVLARFGCFGGFGVLGFGGLEFEAFLTLNPKS